VLLQQDNARPHMGKKTLQKIEELEGIELLPHPAFSPNLEPSVYYMFCSMAQFLCGKSFNL
jgi:histone-lysine N-methyltransferase SETMAR